MTQSGARLILLAAALTTFATLGCELRHRRVGPAGRVTGDVGASFRTGGGRGCALTPGSALGPSAPPQPAATATSRRAAPCVSPSAAADNDGDGVPGPDAIYLLPPLPCRFTGWRGAALDVGALRIQDPAPPGRLRLRGHNHRSPLPLHQRRRQARLRRHPERHPQPKRLHRGAPADHRSPVSRTLPGTPTPPSTSSGW